jgi:hypothetical protein
MHGDKHGRQARRGMAATFRAQPLAYQQKRAQQEVAGAGTTSREAFFNAGKQVVP